MAQPVNEVVTLARRIRKFIRYAGVIALVVAVVVIAREIGNVKSAADSVHPALGWAWLAVVAVVAVRLVGLPVYRFWRMPVAVEPPEVPENEAEWSASHMKARVAWQMRYLTALKKNPLLADQTTAIDLAAEQLEVLRGKVDEATDAESARRAIAQFEREMVEPLLKPLDAEADRVIRAEALAVGIGTAISPNGSLDAFIVLWRNANMVSRLANVYYGKPGVRGSLRILSDVSAAALFATYLEGLSDAAGGVLRGLFGGVAGIVAGPLVDGSVNAIATLRIGYLAKGRCRSFSAWTEAARKRALRNALAAAKSRSKEVLAGVAKAAGGTIADLGGKIADSVKGGFSALFGKKKGDDPGPVAAAAE